MLFPAGRLVWGAPRRLGALYGLPARRLAPWCLRPVRVAANSNSTAAGSRSSDGYNLRRGRGCELHDYSLGSWRSWKVPEYIARGWSKVKASKIRKPCAKGADDRKALMTACLL